MTHEAKPSSLAMKIASAIQKPMSVMGLVSSVKSEVVKGRSVWHILMADGKKLACGNQAIAQALGANGSGVPKNPVNLQVVKNGNVSVVVAAQMAGEQMRRRFSVDLTNPEFINRIAEADASDAAANLHAAIKNSPMKSSPLSIKAEKQYIAWKERADVGSRAWRQGLLDVLRVQKVVADEAVRRNQEGFYLKRLCNLAMNSLACSPAETSRGEPTFLGSMVVGQLHDHVPESKFNTGLSVAWAAYLTIGKYMGSEARKDQKVIADMIARSAISTDQTRRQNELVGALTWAWQVLRGKQKDMDKNRYVGPIGGALQNIETAIQWVGGDIPDHGRLADVPQHIGQSKDKEFVRAIAIQKARGVPIVSVMGSDGNAVGISTNSEKTVFGKNRTAKVFDSDGTLLFEEGNDEPSAPAPRM